MMNTKLSNTGNNAIEDLYVFARMLTLEDTKAAALMECIKEEMTAGDTDTVDSLKQVYRTYQSDRDVYGKTEVTADKAWIEDDTEPAGIAWEDMDLDQVRRDLEAIHLAGPAGTAKKTTAMLIVEACDRLDAEYRSHNPAL